MAASVTDPASTLEKARSLKSKLTGWRRAIHANPELSFQEHETSKLVAATLSELGYKVTTGVGGTGVVGEIGEGRTVILRADMDALPIEEAGGKPYTSTKNGVMHACGHDAHIACGLGAALLLSESPPKNGRVRFLFQPAEETVNEDGKSGATLMIESGATKDAEAVFALHVDPRIPTGHIAVRDGALLAACDSFEIKIKGKGSHGAYPQYGIDAIVLASQVVQTIQTIISRRKSALEPAVLTIGGMRSNTFAHNVIAEEVELVGTVRYFDRSIHSLVQQELKNACEVATSLGGSYELRYSHDTPALTNDPQLANLARFVGKKLLGPEAVLKAGQETGGDDFTFFTAHMPGCYVLLGVGRDDGLRNIHTPTFDINEDALPVGAALLAELAAHYLGR
jgi:amidohydrolase